MTGLHLTSTQKEISLTTQKSSSKLKHPKMLYTLNMTKKNLSIKQDFFLIYDLITCLFSVYVVNYKNNYQK